MTFTKTIAALTLAGAIAVGGASIAGAQTTPAPSSGSFTIEIQCSDVQARLAKMETRIQTAKDRVATATTKRDELAANGRERIAERLTTFIDKANERIPTAEARVADLGAKLAEKCPA